MNIINLTLNLTMKKLSIKVVLGISVIFSILISFLFTSPFTTKISYVFVTPQLAVVAIIAVLAFAMLLNYLLSDLRKEIKIIPFVIPVFSLVVALMFASKFFWFHNKFSATEWVFFPSEFGTNLVLLTSLTIIFTTFYKLYPNIDFDRKLP